MIFRGFLLFNQVAFGAAVDECQPDLKIYAKVFKLPRGIFVKSMALNKSLLAIAIHEFSGRYKH